MGSSEMRPRVAIFGGGRVGTAMSLEMPGVPVIRRGQDAECEVAAVCWPAQAIKEFTTVHPIGGRAIKVAFCNGAWAEEDGADYAGVCYVRACHLGDRAAPGRKAWRVGRAEVSLVLGAAGLGVTCSRGEHEGQVWAKCLYLLPLALAMAEHTADSRLITTTIEYAEWYDVVRCAAVAAVGEKVVAGHEPRVKFLLERTPRGWHPSPSAEELAYFRGKLCAG